MHTSLFQDGTRAVGVLITFVVLEIQTFAYNILDQCSPHWYPTA